MPNHRSLPWCKGPKLAPFDFGSGSSEDIQFLDKLGSGLHSEVYRARINNKQYAIKVFKFWRAIELTPARDLQGGWVTVDEVINHVDPFHCECRAYGRLKETHNEHLAPKCHGYVLLSDKQEMALDAIGNLFQRDSWNKGHPLRAIVKDLLPADSTPFHRKMIPQMKRDIVAFNKLGIIIFDIRTENYVNGQIIDFSQAHTSPHHLLDLQNPSNTIPLIKILCSRDREGFDALVDLWNERHPEEAVWNCFFHPNPAFTSRLRRRSTLLPYHDAPLDAALYHSGRPLKKQKAS